MVPVGRASGTGLVQCLFRRLALKESELPPQLELRKGQPLPCDSAFLVREGWQVHMDNYDEARGYRRTEAMQAAEGKLSCWAICLRESSKALGVLFTNKPDKIKRQEPRTETLGPGSEHRMA